MATSTASPSPTPSTPLGAMDEPEPGPRRHPLFFVTLAAVSLLLGGWAYLLFFYDPGLMIDELADKTFPTQAEDVCAVAAGQLSTLRPANLATNPLDRAETLEQSNVVLSQMIDDLRPLTPTGPQKVTDGVTEWLDDWETYIGNRSAYVDNLRADPEARFLESTKGTSTKGITRAIDGFAEVNEMTSCTTPADVS